MNTMYRKSLVIILLLIGFGLPLADSGFTQQDQSPAGGILIVITDPPGAEVSVDGVARGTTVPEKGLLLGDLSPGKHKLLVHKKWHRAVERELTIEPGKRTVINLGLGQPTGFISVRSSLADSRIEIKGVGSYQNEVHRLEVPAGKYQVKIEPPNAKPRTQMVEVEIGMETDLYVDFGPEAQPGKVEVKSNPVEVINRGRADRALLKVGEHYGAQVRGYLVPEVISIPAGSFQMGSETGGEDEKPVHTVSVDGFDMGRVLVTNAQYKAFCDATNRMYPIDPLEWGNYFKDYSDHPVINVSWEDAMAYCEWLSKITGLKYRLPTEAEWEYAARGGLVGKTYPWGDEDPKGRACYLEGQIPFGVPTMRVGSYPPNGYGLYDMAGNVWQWCWDWYDVSYYRSGNNRHPQGPPGGTNKVARGGAWLYGSNSLRCAIRLQLAPQMQHETVGFRVALVRE
ncbi:MAG: SUMF1/EgtB/PvdO family nonheme iron enzyme [Acidobacteria bacterium]|nr:SUMF1/EgtB/PvdO family nonheme iron enzyme [Acidobacteriota bacterium]